VPARRRQDRWLDLVQAVAVVVLVVVVVGFTEGVGKAGTWASVLGTSLAIIGGITALITSRRWRRAAPVTPEQLVCCGAVAPGS